MPATTAPKTNPRTDPDLGTYCGVGNHAKCRLGAKRCACTCHTTGLPPDPDPAAPAPPPPAARGRVGRDALADTDFAWEDPPPRGVGGRNVALVADLIPELRRNPGRWARLCIFQTDKGANSAKTSLAKVTQFSDIEFAARSNPADKTSTLYGRYTGE